MTRVRQCVNVTGMKHASMLCNIISTTRYVCIYHQMVPTQLNNYIKSSPSKSRLLESTEKLALFQQTY